MLDRSIRMRVSFPAVSRPARRPPASAGRIPRSVVGALMLLSVWELGEQLTDTAVPSLLKVVPYRGICPDIAFICTGLLLVARGRRVDRGWALIGLGSICWGSGDVYWQLKLSAMSSPPVPSWADAGYLAFCPLSFAGILSLVRGRARNAPRTLIADAAAAALTTGALSAALVLEPVMRTASGGALSIATNLAYPLCDLSLLGLLVGATAVGEWRLNRQLLLLGLGVLAFWIADSMYLVAVATNTYSTSQWYNGLWYLTPCLVAWAGWLPAKPQIATVQRGTSRRAIVMLLSFAVAALVVLFVGGYTNVGPVAMGLAAMAVLVVLARLVLTWQENVRLLRDSQREAVTDSLTGLRNRRALAGDLRDRLALATRTHPTTLVLFDLDGFKHYNDSFGHPAGDALLRRLGANLSAYVQGRGGAYRMGGDEFCALIHASDDELGETIRGATAALSESGEGFTVTCSYGCVLLPEEAGDSETALRLADMRMYANKRGGRASASRQSRDVLLRALEERNPTLHAHVRDVAQLAVQTAINLGLSADEVDDVRHAAELHDVGKVAIPDAILDKPGPLDDDEWLFIRRHTVIGERIVTAAPALNGVGALVRSSHENFDGTGYPDQLAGEDIPLGSRIILVCDAFDAMTKDRPYRAAMSEADAVAELRRHGGKQFDPRAVEAFCLALTRLGDLTPATAPTDPVTAWG